MQGVMIANDMVTVPWPYLLVVYLVLMTVFVWCMIFLSGVFGVSHCICLVHDILKWATRRCSSPLFTWQPWKQVSQHQHRCFQSVIIIIIVIVILIIAMGCTQIPISTLSHIWIFVRLYGIVFVIIVIIIIIIMIIKSEGVNAQL